MCDYILSPEEEIEVIKIIIRRNYLLISIVLFISSFVVTCIPYSLNLDAVLFNSIGIVMGSSYSVFSHFFNTGVMPASIFAKEVKSISENYKILSITYMDFYVGKIYQKNMETVTPILLILLAILLTVILANFNPEETLQIIALVGRRTFFKDMVLSVIIIDLLLASSVGIPYIIFTEGFSLIGIVTGILSFFSLFFLVSLLSLVVFTASGNPVSSLVIGLIVFVAVLVRPKIVLYVAPFINCLGPSHIYVMRDLLFYVIIYLLWIQALLIISYKSFMKREIY